MKQNYTAPDFDISVYEVEDVLTTSPIQVGNTPIDNDGWFTLD